MEPLTIMIGLALFIGLIVSLLGLFTVVENFPASANRVFRSQAQKDGQGTQAKVARTVNPELTVVAEDPLVAVSTLSAAGDVIVSLPAPFTAAVVQTVFTQNKQAANPGRTITVIDIATPGQFTVVVSDGDTPVNAAAVEFSYRVRFLSA